MRIKRWLRKANLYFTIVCAVITMNLSEAMRIVDYMKKEGLQ